MRNIRRLSQTLFFIIFIYLSYRLFDWAGDNKISQETNLLFYFNPLFVLTSIFTLKPIKILFLFSIITILITVILGRFFCGWVCPLGTLNQSTSYLYRRIAKKNKKQEHSPFQKTKYLMLIFFIILLFGGINLIGLFDPISLLSRTFTISILPAIQFVTSSLFNISFYYGQPNFMQTILISSIFIVIICLNFKVTRFWCRFLCPLGALLGFSSNFAALKLKLNKDRCTKCKKCLLVCEGACQPDQPDNWIKKECVYCWNCIPACPEEALKFSFNSFSSKSEAKVNLERRRIITSMALGLISIPLIRNKFWIKRESNKLIRPPAALPEKDFLSACIKCGQCMRVCPTNFLQPALMEAGLEGIFSPIGIGKLGYCEYNCNLCTQTCPTGAIQRVSLNIKHRTKIASVHIDKELCLPWSQNTQCITCEEHCPIPQKAITLTETRSKDKNRKTIRLQLPEVNLNLCIGCGICEFKCPVTPKAIRITKLPTR